MDIIITIGMRWRSKVEVFLLRWRRRLAWQPQVGWTVPAWDHHDDGDDYDDDDGDDYDYACS